MRMLIFAFKDTIAEEVAKKIEAPVDKIFIASNLDAIDDLAYRLQTDPYTHVLGLGAYSGRDKDKLRIETRCTSQFRNDKKDLQSLTILHFIQPESDIKLAAGLGNSWCNRVSYSLLSTALDSDFTSSIYLKHFRRIKQPGCLMLKSCR